MKKGMYRRLAFQCIALIFGLAMCLGTPSSASAGGCNWYTPCGEVTNSSSWTLQLTTTLGSGPHYCDVWNWNGGGSAAWMHAKCTQENLGVGQHKGGGSVDVDAFTYNSRDYILNFKGTLSWKTKGVWTKIQNTEGATCYTESVGVPICYVYNEL